MWCRKMAEMAGNPACIWGNMPEISAADLGPVTAGRLNPERLNCEPDEMSQTQ